MTTELMIKKFENVEVFFMEDGYINATKIAKKYGKKPNDWLCYDETYEYGLALAKSLDLLNCRSQPQLNLLISELEVCKNNTVRRVKILEFFKLVGLVKIKAGSPENGGGTWLHPKLGPVFARWLSARFAVWCDEQIERILHNYQVSNRTPRFPTILHPILYFPVVGHQEDVLMKQTRNTYTAVLDALDFAAAIYKRVLTNNVSRILIGMPVKPFRRLHGIPAGSQRRTRLFYDSNLRRAMDEIERTACSRLCANYFEGDEVVKVPKNFAEIENTVYEVAKVIKEYARIQQVNLVEHVPERDLRELLG